MVFGLTSYTILIEFSRKESASLSCCCRSLAGILNYTCAKTPFRATATTQHKKDNSKIFLKKKISRLAVGRPFSKEEWRWFCKYHYEVYFRRLLWPDAAERGLLDGAIDRLQAKLFSVNHCPLESKDDWLRYWRLVWPRFSGPGPMFPVINKPLIPAPDAEDKRSPE